MYSSGFTIVCIYVLIVLQQPNGVRYQLVGGIGHRPGALPGRDNAILSESTSSRVNCLKTRTPRSGSPTTMVSVLFLGSDARCVGRS